MPRPMASCNLHTLLTMKNLNSYTGIFVAGAVIGGLAVVYWLPGAGSVLEKNTGTTTAPTNLEASLAPDKSGSVSVLSQAAGMVVVAEAVTVPPPGVWVAVREVQGSSLGNILGAARARGPLSNLEIPLLRETLPATTYAIQLYRDDGDNLFSKDIDSVYVDFDTGEPVIAPFKTL